MIHHCFASKQLIDKHGDIDVVIDECKRLHRSLLTRITISWCVCVCVCVFQLDMTIDQWKLCHVSRFQMMSCLVNMISIRRSSSIMYAFVVLSKGRRDHQVRFGGCTLITVDNVLHVLPRLNTIREVNSGKISQQTGQRAINRVSTTCQLKAHVTLSTRRYRLFMFDCCLLTIDRV
jgi:hypothetical protein